MTEGESPARVDVYSDGDRGLMVRSQAWRGRVLAGVVAALVRLRITADHITLMSLLAGLAACPLLILAPAWGLALLLAHVLLDGLDGPLARAAGTASSRGSFTDSMADQLVVATTTGALVYAHHASGLPGVIYVFSYTVVVGFAMIRNALAIPYHWLIRPRFVVYAWIVVELYWLPGSLDYLLWICSALLGIKVITGFFKISRKI